MSKISICHLVFSMLLSVMMSSEVYSQSRKPRKPSTSRPSRPSKPATRPSRPSKPSRPATRPSRPSRPSKPATRPSRPSRPSKPATRPNRPSRPSKPATRPNRPTRPSRPSTRPTRPNRPNKPVTRPNRPTRPSKPATRPNRPNRPNKPVTRPNRPNRPVTRPNRPNRPNRPVTRPNRPNRPNRPAVRPRPPRRVHRTRPNRRVVRRNLPAHRARRIGTRRYFRPYNHYHGRYVYRRGVHNPFRQIHRHSPLWTHRAYYRHVTSSWNQYVYFNWIYWNTTRSNGYHFVDGYPYYVHNGYRHRYSSVDRCNYQLFDKNNHCIVKEYWNQTCSTGYNACARDRSDYNYQSNDYRFTCAETYREQSYGYFNRYTRGTSYNQIANAQYCSSQDNYYYDDQTDPYYDYEYEDDDYNDYY